MKIYTCQFCNKTFENGKSIGGHIIRCKYNPEAAKIFKRIAEKLKGRKKPSKLNERILSCEKCSNEYKVKCTDYAFEIGKYKKHCSRKCSNSRTWSDEDKFKKSTSAKESEKVKSANKILRNHNIKPKHVDKCLSCGKDIFRVGRKIRKYHNECWKKISGGMKAGSSTIYSCEYKGYKLDSGLEKIFAILLDKCNIKWVKNKSIGFSYIGYDNKKRKYYPDFYLAEYDLWVETKGKIYALRDKNFELKSKSIKNLEILFNKDVKELYKFL